MTAYIVRRLFATLPVMAVVAPEEGRDQFIGTAIAILTQRKAWTAKLKRSELSLAVDPDRG